MSTRIHNNPERSVALPMAYLITFACYGTNLHGDEAGSIDRHHNIPLTPLLPSNPRLWQAERARMRQAPYRLDDCRRQVVLDAFHEVCECRGWELAAVHVRETHVHLVLHALEAPEKVMLTLKAYATRKLNQAKLDSRDRKRWTRHGSTQAGGRRGRYTLCDLRAGRTDGGI